MIDQKDLHIGCWYNFDNPLAGEKTPRRFELWVEAIDFEAYAEPIPLDKDWLERLGFWYDNELEIWCIDDFAGYFSEMKLTFEYNGGQEWQPPCDFVHQIQNIFHSLSGKELTLKEPIQ